MIHSTDFFKLSVAPAPAVLTPIVLRTPISQAPEQTLANGNNDLVKVESDRDVIRCVTCGMVQYRTRNGNCRRCLRLLTPKMQYFIAPSAIPARHADDWQPFEKWPNREMVENIGQRIRGLRESSGITQSQLQALSRVSRSHLSRIESGQMTPGLGTLEKISEALGVGLKRFFVPGTDGESLVEDPFIQELRPVLRQLDLEQWRSILKQLAAISDHVTGGNGQANPLVRRQPAQIESVAHQN
jgi:transcriptional regulator with XRE-family HTH domain